MEYTVGRAEAPDDYKRVQEMIHNFFTDMPVTVVFGLEHSPPNHRPREYGPEDFIVKAADSEGKIIGFAINVFNSPTNVHIPPDRIELDKFLHFVKESAGLGQLPERTIELRILSVAKEWRRRGVARRLAEESMRLAKQAGFVAMRVCCTSEYTARLVKRLGWREHYRLAYADYPKLSGRNVHLTTVPGHPYIYYYVVDI